MPRQKKSDFGYLETVTICGSFRRQKQFGTVKLDSLQCSFPLPKWGTVWHAEWFAVEVACLRYTGARNVADFSFIDLQFKIAIEFSFMY